MKRFLLYILLAVTITLVISCRESENPVQEIAISDAVQTQKPALTLEEKIGRLSNYDIPLLETPSGGFISAEDATVISKGLLKAFFTDDLKDVIDCDFDVNTLADAMSLPSLYGCSDAAMWQSVTLLPNSSDHFEVGIYIEAVTGSLLKIEFQGNMFSPKRISVEAQALFMNRFDELTHFAAIQDITSSEKTGFSRDVRYSTDTSISVKVYIDNGYFTISCI